MCVTVKLAVQRRKPAYLASCRLLRKRVPDLFSSPVRMYVSLAVNTSKLTMSCFCSKLLIYINQANKWRQKNSCCDACLQGRRRSWFFFVLSFVYDQENTFLLHLWHFSSVIDMYFLVSSWILHSLIFLWINIGGNIQLRSSELLSRTDSFEQILATFFWRG